MTRYFAFLRAINVGGHVVKMDRLRKSFESLGFSNVETFIASGNVIFESSSRSAQKLESMIEGQLRKDLGYEVATFIRTKAELIEIANHQPFSPSEVASAHNLNIVFLRAALDNESRRRLLALRTETDDLESRGREVYWLLRKKLSESTMSNTAFGKALGMPATVRGANTVKKMMLKYTNQKHQTSRSSQDD